MCTVKNWKNIVELKLLTDPEDVKRNKGNILQDFECCCY